MPSTLTVKNVAVKVTMGVTGRYPIHTTNGILIRWQDNKHFYGFHVAGGHYSPEPRICLNSRTNTLKGASPNRYHPMDGTPFTLELRAYEGHITGIYDEGISDEVRLEDTDNTINNPGKIDIIVAQSKGWFDNLIIRDYVEPEPTATLGEEEGTSELNLSGWNIHIDIINNGETDATISDILINGRSITSHTKIQTITNEDTGETYYNTTINRFEEGIPIKIGERLKIQITMTMGGGFKHGSNIEILVKTDKGQEYYKTTMLP